MANYEREGFLNWTASVGVLTRHEAGEFFDAIAAHPWVKQVLATRHEPSMTLPTAVSASVAAVGSIDVDRMFDQTREDFLKFWARTSVKVVVAVGGIIAAVLLAEVSVVLSAIVVIVLVFLFAKDALSAGRELIETVMERLRQTIEATI
jgi:hypothetical protein